jgi:hypothetical protein
MKKQFAILCFAASLCLITACIGQANTPKPSSATQPSELSPTAQPGTQTLTPSPPTVTQTEATPSANKFQPPTPTPEEELGALTQYKLIATLDYVQHHLAVEEHISYPNQSGEPISDLLLIVEPARYPGVFHLVNLTWGDESPILEYQREIGQLLIPLEESLPPGGILNLSIDYELFLPSPDPSFYGRPVPFGYSTRQTNLVDWYPFIPPYVPGQGWLAHNAGPFGEHLVYELAKFDIDIHLNDSISNLIIAASGVAEKDGNWYHFDFDEARNFAWSVSDQYELSTSSVDSVTVMSYYFPINDEAGEAVLHTTAEALRLYNELFGPYPRQALTVVEADFLDGMEYDGLYFLSKGFYNLYSGNPADYLTAIAAHETAHQWWYRSVGNDQALEPWLDEALCTYSERLYYENIHPQGLDWWWNYRINYYEPRGWVDGSIYNPEGYRAYRDAIYLNGAIFLEDLRDLIGEEVFFDFLITYAHKFSGEIVTADDFFALLDTYDHAELASLLDRYFLNR